MKTLLELLHRDSARRDAVALSLFCLLILAGFWALIPSQWQANQNYDYFCCYEPVARNVAAGNGWVTKPGVFAGWYPPGFSSLLAIVFLVGGAIGNDIAALKILIAICMVATILLVYATGRAIGGFWLGRAAALCAMGYPFLLWLTKQPNSETPFVPLVLAAVYGYVRMLQEGAKSDGKVLRWAVLCGAASGFASLTRPIAVLTGLLLAVCAWFILRHTAPVQKRLAMVAAVLTVNLVTILPWEVTLHNNVGRWVLLANNSGAAIQEGLIFGISDPPYRKGAPVPQDVLAMMERARQKKEQVASLGGMLNFVKDELAASPATALKFIGVKATRAWYATHETYQEGRTAAIQGLFMLLAAFGMWRLRHRENGGFALAMLLLTLYFWGMAMLVMPLLRYMVPMTVVLMVGAGATVLAVVERLGWNLMPAGAAEARTNAAHA